MWQFILRVLGRLCPFSGRCPYYRENQACCNHEYFPDYCGQERELKKLKS